MGLSSYRLNAFIAVTEMTRAEEFYEGKLGLSAVRTDADGSKVYASGGDESLVVYPSPDHAGRSTRPSRPGTSTTSSRWSTS
jgi:catechol-2,3-dioxygenase